MTANVDEKMIAQAIDLAQQWQDRANALLTKEERRIQRQMTRLIRNPTDKVVLTKMIDQSFRPSGYARVADQVNFVLRKYGVPEFFSPQEKLLMGLFLNAGRFLPRISIPQMIEKIREDSARSVLRGEKDFLYPHLKARREAGVRMNLNHLGEAVLGEGEAISRLNDYLRDLAEDEIEYISVKISTIYSQISSLAFDHTVAALKDRLAQLFRSAGKHVFTHQDGRVTPKFVNLDMEEYRDLDITFAAFTQTLDQPEFKSHSAGIVLQAYLPDSHPIQQKLTEWAKQRVAHGGAPIKLRIVKGANMEMELVESALHNWPLAPYDNKLDVDANYKRMVEYGTRPENIQAVHLGIASHNLFELAHAYLMAKQRKALDGFTFEMLEGMADHVRRAVQEISGEVILYAPVATQQEFVNAIAYLIRRLDENTGDENFLRYSFNLTANTPEWAFLKDQFLRSCRHQDQAPLLPNRVQDRSTETFSQPLSPFYTGHFTNEPDTDWALAPNRVWAERIRDQWRKGPDDPPIDVPLAVAGSEIFDGRNTRDCSDSNQYKKGVQVARVAMGTAEDAQKAVETAKADPDGWREKTHAQRHEILAKAAQELRLARADLIGAAAANTGKVFTESDPEVSEAIDFTEFYPHSMKNFTQLPNIRCTGKGVGVVLSPWNFPIAIPTGGIAASLAAGNTVIFKPASAAAMTAWYICQCFWRAGVSQNTLQFLPCSGGEVGSQLTHHPDLDYIILTGGTETGMTILKERPGVYLAAETGGKNATIVTAMADRDQAIKNVLHSAFSNCGQKCSATSLLILEGEIYDDPHFKQQLVDAAKSMAVGSAWKFHNRIGPLIAPPKGDLKNALVRLEDGESWALEPQNVENNPYLWSPGIKWGVQPNSYTHMTEFFGPVLGVMRAENLDQAIALVNATPYGLTSGIESLDQREQNRWKESIQAGNLYINRGTTGAVVLRQAFGGMKKSALGAGIKAGSPNYVSQFMQIEEIGPPAIGAIQTESALLRIAQEWRQKLYWGGFDPALKPELQKTVRAIRSYLYWAEQEFFQEKDYFHLRGQDNIFRYRRVGKVALRVHEKDGLFETLARIAALRVSQCPGYLSLPIGLDNGVTDFLQTHEGQALCGRIPLTHERDDQLANAIPRLDRIRYAAPERVPQSLFAAAAEHGFYIARSPVMMEGRIELLHYFREQAICDNYHRYGNLGDRALS